MGLCNDESHVESYMFISESESEQVQETKIEFCLQFSIIRQELLLLLYERIISLQSPAIQVVYVKKTIWLRLQR